MGDTRRRDRLVRLLERVRPARYRAAARRRAGRDRAFELRVELEKDGIVQRPSGSL
jgi:hypothetical protein